MGRTTLVLLSPTPWRLGGQRAREGSAIRRPSMRREHVLDRQREERAQPRGDPLSRHAGGKPPLVDLEASAEVDERVAADHRARALEPENDVVRLVPGDDL